MISYGGFAYNNYDTQISSDYGPNGGNHISYRTRNGDNNTWNPWNELAIRGTNTFTGNQIINGFVGIGTNAPETLLNVNIGSGGLDGIAGIRVGGLSNYSSLELGIDGDYDGMIRSFGNNINYYAGHWKTKGIPATEDHSHNWYTSKKGSTDWSSVKMTLNSDGNLGIGTINPKNKLDVKGTVHAQEVKVDMKDWSDFVFKKEYILPTLAEVEKHITEKGHLKNIPNEEEVLKNGINLGEMNAKLLQKIEELTLYSIQQNKKIEEQSKEIELLKNLALRITKIEDELKQK
ncbi:hypothetical protein KHA98_22360 [Flavobacterium branchiicola]|nr:hypothetical protein [Flavobacterium branchiicola]